MSLANHDDNLFAILKECKTLPVFLDAIFGFLKRRTDFYYVAENKESSVGLPPGVAENLLKSSYFKWGTDDYNDDHTPENKQQPNQKSDEIQQTRQEFTNAESYNGAVCEKYSWSQSISDLDIIIKIPENTTVKQLNIDIQSNKICVKLKDKVLVEGELCRKIKANDGIWSIDKTKLSIHLEKAGDIWWDCLMISETRLDVTKIDCSRPFDELSDEAQAKIEELTWNQERKRMGLPTSKQIDMENKLKKAWDVQGSPFKGPFDPTTVKMNW